MIWEHSSMIHKNSFKKTLGGGINMGDGSYKPEKSNGPY